ncbi:DUF2510 domain-containing protein [Galbitalea soli]|uniref:DUF2510 domain-containing protein n=1 Tax=Galbitalea soli TaxID=1268042 RepID=A0A7C9PNW0_9MICO|nr:DUF2510 domain-containing protein [Galbitalea soli]NEM91688.1 DUF2510 domain-containing protein [Galbitalea soli]NYJ30384.1 hypothetical protein [Galbitalea soli]
MSLALTDTVAPFGWYPDPAGSGMLRWWDGAQWTDHLEYPRPEIHSAAGIAKREPALRIARR